MTVAEAKLLGKYVLSSFLYIIIIFFWGVDPSSAAERTAATAAAAVIAHESVKRNVRQQKWKKQNYFKIICFYLDMYRYIHVCICMHICGFNEFKLMPLKPNEESGSKIQTRTHAQANTHKQQLQQQLIRRCASQA